jgi:hypothetical protein
MRHDADPHDAVDLPRRLLPANALIGEPLFWTVTRAEQGKGADPPVNPKRLLILEDATMCPFSLGLMATLAPSAIFVGLMVWKDGIGETPPEADARVTRRTMSPRQPASSTR